MGQCAPEAQERPQDVLRSRRQAAHGLGGGKARGGQEGAGAEEKTTRASSRIKSPKEEHLKVVNSKELGHVFTQNCSPRVSVIKPQVKLGYRTPQSSPGQGVLLKGGTTPSSEDKTVAERISEGPVTPMEDIPMAERLCEVTFIAQLLRDRLIEFSESAPNLQSERSLTWLSRDAQAMVERLEQLSVDSNLFRHASARELNTPSKPKTPKPSSSSKITVRPSPAKPASAPPTPPFALPKCFSAPLLPDLDHIDLTTTQGRSWPAKNIGGQRDHWINSQTERPPIKIPSSTDGKLPSRDRRSTPGTELTPDTMDQAVAVYWDEPGTPEPESELFLHATPKAPRAEPPNLHALSDTHVSPPATYEDRPATKSPSLPSLQNLARPSEPYHAETHLAHANTARFPAQEGQPWKHSTDKASSPSEEGKEREKKSHEDTNREGKKSTLVGVSRQHSNVTLPSCFDVPAIDNEASPSHRSQASPSHKSEGKAQASGLKPAHNPDLPSCFNFDALLQGAGDSQPDPDDESVVIAPSESRSPLSPQNRDPGRSRTTSETSTVVQVLSVESDAEGSLKAFDVTK